MKWSINHIIMKVKLSKSRSSVSQIVVDQMQDAFVQVDEFDKIIDFNKSFYDLIGAIRKVSRGESIIDLAQALKLVDIQGIDIDNLMERIPYNGDPILIQKTITYEEKEYQYKIKKIPIVNGKKYRGCVFLINYITEYMERGEMMKEYQSLLKKDLESITKERQDMLIRSVTVEKMAHTDQLTDMYNHRTFQDYFGAILSQADNPNYKMQLAILDIDNFKSVNDMYGHAVGDIVIMRIAKRIKELVTKDDIAARYGGEEFAIIFNSKDIEETYTILAEIREEVEAQKYREIEKSVTISIGLHEYICGECKATVFKKADEALYKAKTTGKNRIAVI